MLFNGVECIRCGGCCKALPCWFAQIVFDIREVAHKPCPELRQNKDNTFTCLAMSKNDRLRREMIGSGCHNPEFRINLVKVEGEAKW